MPREKSYGDNDNDQSSGGSSPQSDKEQRSNIPDDPKWRDTQYVILHYKTEFCKKPPRLCRQGYACPYYHNGKDKRRSYLKIRYRSETFYIFSWIFQPELGQSVWLALFLGPRPVQMWRVAMNGVTLLYVRLEMIACTVTPGLVRNEPIDVIEFVIKRCGFFSNYRTTISSGNIQVDQVQRHDQPVVLSKRSLLCICTLR